MTHSKNVPYYIAMAVYLAFNTVIYFALNQEVTGTLSDVYLGASTLCALLTVITVLYILMEDDGEDATEANVELFGITFNKGFWYIGCIAVIGVRLYFAYQSNHNATGAESVWGYVWFVASIVLLLMTWANSKGYFKKCAKIAEQKRREARHPTN